LSSFDKVGVRAAQFRTGTGQVIFPRFNGRFPPIAASSDTRGWTLADKETFVAEEKGVVLGTPECFAGV